MMIDVGDPSPGPADAIEPEMNETAPSLEKPLAVAESPLTPPPVTGPGLEVDRVLGHLVGEEPGPTLVLVGGLHGNEPAGVLGIQAVFERLIPEGIPRGRVLALAGNLAALRQRRRYLVVDLNRHWSPGRIEALGHCDEALTAEDAELCELLREIRAVQTLTPPGEPVHLLDIHTFSAPGIAFTPLEDSLPNRSFAHHFQAPVVLGLEEELSGTMTSWASSSGIIASGFESGQHDDAVSVDRAAAAVWIALEAAGIYRHGECPEAVEARRRLAEECAHLPTVVEVRYRHAISEDDWFRMDPGYENFQAIAKGEVVGVDRWGPVESPRQALVLMPLYQLQGADGFFLVEKVRRLWLELSAVVRRFGLERYLHLLPGVERHPEEVGTFIVDRQRARYLARQLFHLLGFQRRGHAGERFLMMTRRPYDLAQKGAWQSLRRRRRRG